MLRHRADYRTLLWLFGFAPSVMAAQYLWPSLMRYLLVPSLYLGVSAAIIAHNHNHCATFSSRRYNEWFDKWLAIFYGYPTFAFIPTHNLDHHKRPNRPGDATITWRFSNRHALWVACTYFFVSAFYQQEPIRQFVGRAKQRNPKLYAVIRSQVAFLGLVYTSLLGLAVSLHGFGAGLWVWTVATLFPALFALWAVQFLSYEQHVHTDAWSEHDHSRNFVSGLANFLLFNNGYHTAHHHDAGLHWSQLPALDGRMAHLIHPALRERSLSWYLLRQYLLSLFFRRLGTRQLGRAPFDTPSSRVSQKIGWSRIPAGPPLTKLDRSIEPEPMTQRIPAMPYVDFVLGELGTQNEVARQAWGRNLHFGYWAQPDTPDISIEGYERATDEMTRQHFDRAGIAPGQKIADVGCGLGGTLALLNETFDGLNLVGVNIDERQVHRAKASLTPRPGSGNEIAVVLGDACQLPFEDASLDVVFSVECIFHFGSRRRYFHEVRRVLKPGGRLIISEFVVRPWAVPFLFALYVPFHSAVRGTYGDSAPPVTAGFYEKIGRQNGLELLHVNDVTSHTLPNYEILPRLMAGAGSSATFRRGVQFLQYATRFGFYRYDILSFRAR
jgi:beta-carotene hydroxylase